jgi:CheY-like chemotaxis protein
MPPEVLARALEPFFTTKDSGKGSGLGLSMVYGFIKQSGGHLTIESQLGYGTRIDLFLPATSAGATTVDEPRTSGEGHGREAILVVEDEPEVRGIAVAFLRSLGYTPHAASDATQALVVLSAHPEIVLMFSDVVLGSGNTGYELAREAWRTRPDLRVLLTSGYESTFERSGSRGGDNLELLRKPYRREELAAAVRRTLDRVWPV